MTHKKFTLPIRVYYEDTDVAGVVYYANYLKFYERGRTEWLRSLGWEQDVLIKKNLAFAVAHVDVTYKKPARFNDALIVTTSIKQVKKSSIIFEQTITIADKTQREQQQNTIINSALIRVACVQMDTMRPTAMPDYLLEEITREWC